MVVLHTSQDSSHLYKAVSSGIVKVPVTGVPREKTPLESTLYMKNVFMVQFYIKLLLTILGIVLATFGKRDLGMKLSVNMRLKDRITCKNYSSTHHCGLLWRYTSFIEIWGFWNFFFYFPPQFLFSRAKWIVNFYLQKEWKMCTFWQWKLVLLPDLVSCQIIDAPQ